MSKKLSSQDWFNIAQPPFYWLRTSFLDGKPSIYREMVNKWLDQTVTTWWYSDGDVFVFSNMEDRTTFKLWILSDAFREDHGDIEN